MVGWTRTAIAGWSLAYVAIMAGIVWGFQYTYAWGTATLDTTVERDNWQDWRNAVDKQNKQGGPVERRAPKSSEPPLLVLMRDHYTTCLVAALIFASAIFVSLMFMVRGVAKRQKFTFDEPEA